MNLHETPLHSPFGFEFKESEVARVLPSERVGPPLPKAFGSLFVHGTPVR